MTSPNGNHTVLGAWRLNTHIGVTMTMSFFRKPRTDPALDRFPPTMAALITRGKPAEEIDYAAWAEQLREHVPDLIRMVFDDDLNERTEDDPAV